MASGISLYLENKWLDTMRGSAAVIYTMPANIYVELATTPITPPDTAGTVANAGERQEFIGTASTTGAIENTADITWTNVATTETYNSISLWDASAAGTGNMLWLGDLTTPKPVTAGDTFTIAAGDLDITLE
jgi:hypothetical protein